MLEETDRYDNTHVSHCYEQISEYTAGLTLATISAFESPVKNTCTYPKHSGDAPERPLWSMVM